MNNKLIKGAVAGAAGIALLLGGAGTFAAWNQSKTASPSTSIQTGTLTIDTATPDGWYTSDDGTGAVNISTFHAVPGDVLYYEATATITATGDNLSAEIGVNSDTLNASLASAGATGKVTASIDKVTGPDITASNGAYTFGQSAGTISADVYVKVEFPFDGFNEGTDAQGTAISLDPFDITLTQIES